MRGSIAFLTVLILASSAVAEDWPQWRGPRGNGVSIESGLPLRWADDENVAWTAQLSGLSVSTPIIHGDRVFVTGQAGRGVLREGNHPTLMRGEEKPSEKSLGALGESPASAEGEVTLPRRSLRPRERAASLAIQPRRGDGGRRCPSSGPSQAQSREPESGHGR